MRLTPVGRRRNPAALILAVLCIAGGALAGTIAYKASSGRISVLAVARAVSAGHALQAADLRVVDISADGGLSLVPASEEATVVGRPAGVPLAAGAPLTRAELGSASSLPPGEAVVGVLCKGGQYPPSLAPGDRVEVIDAGGVSTGAPVSTPSLASGEGLTGSVVATVVGIDTPPDVTSAGMVISLRLTASDAPSVARAAVAGRMALVLVAPGELTMGMVVLTSVKELPGVTTVALALAAVWPADRRVVLAEVDPAGGDLAPRFGLRSEPGLLTLAAAIRHGAPPMDGEVLAQHCQELPGGLLVLSGPAPSEAQVALEMVSPALPALASDLGADLIVDVGRLEGASMVPSVGGDAQTVRRSARSAVACLVERSDRVLIVTRNDLAGLAHVAAWLPLVRSLAPRLGLVLIDSGPYRPDEVEAELGVEVVAALPVDRAGATVLGGRPHTGRVLRLPLFRAVTALAETLAAELSRIQTSPAPNVGYPAPATTVAAVSGTSGR